MIFISINCKQGFVLILIEMEQVVANNGEFYIYLEQVDIVVPNTAKQIICS